jgi:AcrR family transcriptional regulator
MPGKESYHHGRLKQELLERALQAIEERGVEALSLRDLAQESGVSKTAPYRHFKDKRQLLVEAAAEGFSLLADRLESCGTDLKPVMRAYVEFARSRPGLYRLMFSRLGYELHSERCRVNADRAMGALVKAAAAAQSSGWKSEVDPPALVLSLWSLAHGWAGLLIEDLVPERLGFIEENWFEAAAVFL